MDRRDTAIPAVVNSQNLTIDKLKKMLPKGSSVRVTEEIMAKIHRTELDTGVSQELVEEQIVSYLHLLTGNVGIEKLLNAIKFCNLKMLPKMGNARAYSIVFPEKTEEVTARGETVDSFASMYNNTKMVVEIQKLLIVPAYITYQPMFHAAVKKQFDLMNGIGAKGDDKVSAHVQHLAAGKLAELTAMPEDNSIVLRVGLSDEAKSVQQGLMEQLARTADIQMQRLANGESITDVQKIGIDFIDVPIDTP